VKKVKETHMRIAVDGMGTDVCPGPDVEGSVLAARELGVSIALVGDEHILSAELQKHNWDGLPIEIFHAADTITMGDKPAEVGKAKPNSSMHVGMGLVENGYADAFVSAGNTGAALAIASLHTLKRLRGIKRPALTAVGRLRGNLITIVDVGANTDTKLEWLIQFGWMGNLYAKKVLDIENPRVGLLANGSEAGKGDQLVRDANDAFRQEAFEFIGNVEPKDLLSGRVDVIVTDGYVGNILLKTYEAAVENTFDFMRGELKRNLRSKLGALLAKPYLRTVANGMDPTQYGGAPLLGINGVVIITHGGSSARVIRNSIQQAIRAVDANVIDAMKEGLAERTAKNDRKK
jgi:glycerol-3-phosphate acyltransferase PlsX